MVRWIGKCLAAVAVLLYCLPLLAKNSNPVPQEVSSAKSVALVVRIVATPGHQVDAVEKYRAKIEAKAIAEIQKQKYFELASDPAAADIVCLLVAHWAPMFREGKSIWSHSASEMRMHPPAAIMVFKGGSNPQSSAAPLWTATQTGGNAAWLLDDFQKAVKETRAHPSSAVAQNGNSATNAAFSAPTQDSKPPTEASVDAPHQDSASPAAETPASAPENAENDSSPQEPPDPQSASKADATQQPERQAAPDAPDATQVDSPFCHPDFKNCRPPKEIYAAKTLMLCDARNRCNLPKLQDAFPPTGRWTLVQDPAKADLIAIVAVAWVDDPGSGGLVGGLLGGAQYSTLYFFKGGSQPDWQSMPLFTTVAGGGLFSKVRHDPLISVLQDMEKFLGDTNPSNPPAMVNK